MIIFFESGRLGNQLFQYCAMRKFQSNGPIVAIGMQEFKSMFTGVDLVGSSIFGKFIEKLIGEIGKEFFNRITREFGIFSLVEEIRSPACVSFKVTPGWINKIVYFNEGYYQADNIVESKVTNCLALKDEITTLANTVLQQIPCRPKERFFVHIRRGDYLTWPSAEYPAVLPLSWYLAQMTRIREKSPNAHFIIASDDYPYVKDSFSKEENVFIMTGDLSLDFAVMTYCLGGGILSASSFSWWGAYFCRRNNTSAVFSAPYFWGGHGQEKWHPLAISTSWINYYKVN